MKLSSLTIDLGVTPGADLTVCCEEAQRVANLLGIDARFTFNGIGCRALPGGDPRDLAAKCWHAMSLRGQRTVRNGAKQ